jgi:hypothetical protein
MGPSTSARNYSQNRLHASVASSFGIEVFCHGLLDNNLQLLWPWDSFQHLDVTRKATLKPTRSFEVEQVGSARCQHPRRLGELPSISFARSLFSDLLSCAYRQDNKYRLMIGHSSTRKSGGSGKQMISNFDNPLLESAWYGRLEPVGNC